MGALPFLLYAGMYYMLVSYHNSIPCIRLTVYLCMYVRIFSIKLCAFIQFFMVLRYALLKEEDNHA